MLVLKLSLDFLRERLLFTLGVGTEEEELCSLRKTLPHHLLKSNLLCPTEGNSKTRVHLCLNMVCFYATSVVKNYSSTLPYTAYVLQLPHHLSSGPTPVINNDRSLNENIRVLVPLRCYAVRQAEAVHKYSTRMRRFHGQ